MHSMHKVPFISPSLVKLARKIPYKLFFARTLIRFGPKISALAPFNRKLNTHISKRPIEFKVKTKNGFSIKGTTTDLIQRYIFLYGVWEPNLSYWLKGRLKPGDYFVDVGANIGYFTLLASKCVGKKGQVISVEASPAIFKKLCTNVNHNRKHNTRLINKAVTDKTGHIQLFSAPASNLGRTSIYHDEYFADAVTVETKPLADILSTEEIQRARIIKIDVEGAEQLVLTGLLPCLKESSENLEIVIEVGGGPETSPDAKIMSVEIINSLAQHGYHAYQLENDYSPEDYYCRYNKLPHPRRVTESISERVDLIFSKQDQDYL